MITHPPCIIIGGLLCEVEAPRGMGLVRAIRRSHPDAFIVGLVYDAMEAGHTFEDGPDLVFSIPHPCAGARAWLQGLDQVLSQSPADLIIPTLEVEIELLAELEHELAERGLMTCLPDQEMLSRCAKSWLPALARDCRIAVPDTKAVYGTLGAVRAAAEIGYPLMVKGLDYGAMKVHSEAEFIPVVARLLAEWGAPAIIQRYIQGPEFAAVGIGDGEGGMVGFCCTRPPSGCAGGNEPGDLIQPDPRLERLCVRLIAELKWRGPFEIAVMQNEATDEFCLLGLNPRLPPWVNGLPDQGANLAAILVETMISRFDRSGGNVLPEWMNAGR